jgi:hypothetical protein
MEVMKKTDICISVIQNAISTLSYLSRISNLNNRELQELKLLHDEFQEHWGNFSCDKFKRMEDLFPKRALIKELTRLKALFYYRILPVCNYDIMYRDEDDVYTNLCINNHYTGGEYFREVWKILQEDAVCLNDLEDEFWIICPDIKSIADYLKITRVKFNQINSKLPLLEILTIEDLFCKPNKYRDTFDRLSKISLITDDEIKLIFTLAISIAKSIKINMDLISSMYNKLKCMNRDNVIEDKISKNDFTLPKECDTERFKSMLNKAIKKDLVRINNNGTLYFDGSDALLSCFCGFALCGDSLKWDPATRIQIIKKGNEGLFPNNPLNKLFNARNLGKSRTQILEKEPPGGFENILDIIKETA